MNVAEDRSSFVRLTYQVLPQLFVVGDDAVVDDNKRCEHSSKHVRQIPDVQVSPPVVS